MTTRQSRMAAALAALLLTLGALAAQPASADEASDTTAPQVDLNPCFGESTCRRVVAQVFGDLVEGDDLAVLGARIGDQVLAEQVYDDGSGFVPYGDFFSYGNDVGVVVDYALSVTVPRGSSDITFYARDLAGNTTEETTTVLGPVPPTRVRDLRARRVGHRKALVSWSEAGLRGLWAVRYDVSSPGLPDRSCATAVPAGPCYSFTFRHLSPGWHRFTAHATTAGGAGPERSVRVHIPRLRHGHS